MFVRFSASMGLVHKQSTMVLLHEQFYTFVTFTRRFSNKQITNPYFRDTPCTATCVESKGKGLCRCRWGGGGIWKCFSYTEGRIQYTRLPVRCLLPSTTQHNAVGSICCNKQTLAQLHSKQLFISTSFPSENCLFSAQH